MKIDDDDGDKDAGSGFYGGGDEEGDGGGDGGGNGDNDGDGGGNNSNDENNDALLFYFIFSPINPTNCQLVFVHIFTIDCFHNVESLKSSSTFTSEAKIR